MLTKLKTWYAIHKWLSVVTGVAIVMWLITGLVMTAPDLWGYAWPVNHYQAKTPDFRHVTLSPAKAVAQLATTLGTAPTVERIDLVTIADVLVYRIVLAGVDQPYLLDSMTGKVFTLSPEQAAQVARTALGSDAPLVATTYLATHEAAYLYEAVPAYRFAFADARQSTVYVSTDTGEVYVKDRFTRWLARLEALHTFHIGDLVWPKREQLVTGLLWLASIATISTALIGYYLALPRRWQAGRRG
jgi:hypothetical protein